MEHADSTDAPALFEVLLAPGRGLRMETTVATLQLGADSFQVQKRIWYINAGVASVLADPQQGIAWARFGSCCSKFDTTLDASVTALGLTPSSNRFL